MSRLGDDELSLILNYINDPEDRSSFSLVCKQWCRVEGQNRFSIRVLDPDSLQSFLPRFPNLLSFESSGCLSNSHLQFVAKTCPKIQFLNLNLKQTHQAFGGYGSMLGFRDVGDDGICAIANGCPKLSKVSLRRRTNIGNVGIISIVKDSVQTLTNLDLGRCSLIDDQVLEAIGKASVIRALNLEGCSLITDQGLVFLTNGYSSKSLKKLVLAECDRVTDFGVSFLRQMSCLEELNLAECGPKVTDIGGIAIASMKTLKRLNLSWLINVSDHTLTAIAKNCKNLAAIDLTGCELITGSGIRAFGHHRCLESLVLTSCYNICAHDLDVVFTCQSLRRVVLDKGLRIWIPTAMQDRISSFCQLHWR
ncbi:F-box/LRR-repeat protein [Melia azedarach]|uniref:F-box/LRR-repeat protein n=2 Tax=Melia azedarach TaxID=155640 RepID=A0ACC1X9G7_MELAZ|nr:F-box/LRR-repeat protein [Melia azedarach]KAJ4708081.1 F-box/LRR-repeat protein [Melia azedarach]